MTTHDVTIRTAIADDAAALAELAESTFRDAFAAQNDPANIELYCAKSFGVSKQRQEIQDEALTTLVATQGERLVAFAQVRTGATIECVKAARPAELCRLYVQRDWHGAGLAQELMHEVTTIAARHDADAIWLSVWEHNPRAIAFYRKLGFETAGDQVFVVGNDPQRDFIMVRRLSESRDIARD